MCNDYTLTLAQPFAVVISFAKIVCAHSQSPRKETFLNFAFKYVLRKSHESLKVLELNRIILLVMHVTGVNSLVKTRI